MAFIRAVSFNGPVWNRFGLSLFHLFFYHSHNFQVLILSWNTTFVYAWSERKPVWIVVLRVVSLAHLCFPGLIFNSTGQGGIAGIGLSAFRLLLVSPLVRGLSGVLMEFVTGRFPEGLLTFSFIFVMLERREEIPEGQVTCSRAGGRERGNEGRRARESKKERNRCSERSYQSALEPPGLYVKSPYRSRE